MTNGDLPSSRGPQEDLLSSRLSALLVELAAAAGGEREAWDAALRPGTVIGRFELLREVGRGGFGIVYEARDTALGRNVAFKAVRAGTRPALCEERLLREAEAAARLSHPNIVTLFDVGRSEHGPYLVLELLRGQTLGARMAQGPLPLRESLRVAVEVARGVAHAHAHGVVHRDLKPGNVFLCEDGQVKVLDLGMAHAFGWRGSPGGTPGYMAPEQRRGAPEDERTDVFALGVILYGMLANERPFAAGSGRPMRRAPELEVPGAPALGGFLASMLDPDPVNRPRDAGAVLAALTVFLNELERARPAPSAAVARRRTHPSARAVLRLIAATAAGIAVGWAVNRVSHRAPPTATLEPAPASIAVLPFADLSPKKDQEYFSDGLAEEIIDALAHIDGLRVPGRTSSFFFKGKAARLADIGRELHVAAVLEGSVRRVGNRVRVTTQIINVADGYRVWGQTYDRELTDIFAVQDEIARAVAEALNVKIGGQDVRASREHATRNPETYAQYLIGRHQYHQVTRHGYALAVQAYERALATEPGYAPAWAGLGLPLYLLAEDAESPAVAEALRQRAMAAAEKAVALAPDLTDALSTLGYLRAAIGLDWSGGVADLRRAVALNGKDADARRRHGLLLAHLGRAAEGIAEVRQAVELDPLGQSWVALGTLHQEAGQLGLAEAAFRRYLQISPESAPALLGLGRTLLLQGKAKEALATFERCPEDWRLWGRAVAEHSLGNPGASKTALDAFAARYGGTSAFRLAQAHAWRGEEARALELLERPLAEQGGLQVALKTDPFLRPLRGNTRYIALLQRMKLPVD